MITPRASARGFFVRSTDVIRRSAIKRQLEFRLKEDRLVQTATFRPQGLVGRLYWFSVLPAHWLLFPGMARRLAAGG